MLALFCLSTALHAQPEAPAAQLKAPARFQIYGGYTYLSNTFNGVPGSRQALNGWDASVGFPAWHNLRFKVDAYGYRGTNLDAPQHAFFIMGGGQYNWHLGRETVFAEGLVGDGGLNRNWGAAQAPGETASFATLLGGGLDTPLTRHIAFRVDGGFQYSYFALIQPPPYNSPYRIPGLPTDFGRLSSGLLWQF